MDVRKKHDEVRRFLDGHVTDELFKKLKDSLHCLEELLPKQLEDKIKDFSDLFTILEKEEKIKVGNYEIIIEALKANRQDKLANDLRTKQEEIKAQTNNRRNGPSTGKGTTAGTFAQSQQTAENSGTGGISNINAQSVTVNQTISVVEAPKK